MTGFRVEALVLAGSSNGKGEYRPLKPVAGRPMITYVVEALRNCAAVQRLAVAGPKENLTGLWPEEVYLVSSGANPIETLRKGLAEFEPREWLLVATADMPFLTTAAVQDFLDRCESQSEHYNFFYSVVRRDVYEAFCPEGHRTYARLREGSLTGGNLFLVRPEIVVPACWRGEELIHLRKSPIRMARLIGPGFLLRYLCGRLRLAEAEERFSALLGLKGKAVMVPYACVGFDADRPEHFALAEKILQGTP